MEARDISEPNFIVFVHEQYKSATLPTPSRPELSDNLFSVTSDKSNRLGPDDADCYQHCPMNLHSLQKNRSWYRGFIVLTLLKQIFA